MDPRNVQGIVIAEPILHPGDEEEESRTAMAPENNRRDGVCKARGRSDRDEADHCSGRCEMSRDGLLWRTCSINDQASTAEAVATKVFMNARPVTPLASRVDPGIKIRTSPPTAGTRRYKSSAASGVASGRSCSQGACEDEATHHSCDSGVDVDDGAACEVQCAFAEQETVVARIQREESGPARSRPCARSGNRRLSTRPPPWRPLELTGLDHLVRQRRASACWASTGSP